MLLLTCTVAPGQRMNSLENMFLRKLKLLKTSSAKQSESTCGGTSQCDAEDNKTRQS